MPTQMNNELGKIVYQDKVLAKIACESAMESYGIVGLVAQNPKDGLYELLGWENMTRGVNVRILEDQSVDVSISVFIDYGVRIAVVCANMIEKIRYNIETKTAVKVSNIDVIVQGIKA